jgi:hypothetical protein
MLGLGHYVLGDAQYAVSSGTPAAVDVRPSYEDVVARSLEESRKVEVHDTLILFGSMAAMLLGLGVYIGLRRARRIR